jgi:CRISPR-associated exonuclease Cas4
MEADENLYHATPQIRGRNAHESVDNKTASVKNGDMLSLPVFSDELGIMGKIDVYRYAKKLLVERKYQLKQIFSGQIYQLWAQYFCMIEMGYEVSQLAFYEISTNKMIPAAMPQEAGKQELISLIHNFKNYNPTDSITVNPNKCAHCIYCNLCDKTNTDNVYT